MTRDQTRASAAFAHVTSVSDPVRKEYASLCMKAPVLLKTAGLIQFLEFVARDNDASNELFLQHLALQLSRVDTSITSSDMLRTTARSALLPKYMHLTRELSATLLWYRRFAQSELGAEPTDEVRP